jgi:hypothetical protein
VNGGVRQPKKMITEVNGGVCGGSKVSIRYIIGRVEQFEVELFGRASAEARYRQ